MSLPNYDDKRHEFEQNFAIIIGINEYKSERNKLKAAVNDAKRLAVFLGDEKRKTIWQGDEWYQVLLLTDKEATHENLTKLLDNLKKGEIDFPGQIIEFKNQKIQVHKKEKPVTLQNWNRLLFYFAGHGDLDQDKSKNSFNSLQLWSQDEKKVPVEDLVNTLKELRCQHKLLILDCCYSAGVQGSFGKQETSYRTPSISGQKSYRRDYDYLWRNPTFTVITSGGYRPVPDCGESTPEHSPFAGALFDALENGYYDRKTDSNNDKILTVHEIYNYILGDNSIKTKQHPEIFFPTEKETMLGQYFFLTDDFNPKDLVDIKERDNPYKGLFAYEEEDKPIFGGRDELVKKLFEYVNQEQNNQKFTILTGASGSGKSSIVKAGLIPLLRDSSISKTGSEPSHESNQAKQWTVLEIMRPGNSPLTALAKTILPIYDNDLISKIDEQLLLINTNGKNITRNKKLSMLIDSFDDLKKKNNLNINKLEELRKKTKAKLDELIRVLNQNTHQKEPEAIISLINHWTEKSKDNNPHIFLFIDQFEELITLSEPPEKELFLKLLVQIIEKSTNFHIVVTVRSDFEIYFRGSSKTPTKSDISQYWNRDARLVVEEMNSDQLRQAIIIPSRRFLDIKQRILVFESEALVSKIIDDVRGMPGALALLSFTLEELYKTASSRQDDDHKIIIKEEDYNKLDGVAGALTKKATDVYNKLGKPIEEKDKGQFTKKYEQECQNQNKPIPAEEESCQISLDNLFSLSLLILTPFTFYPLLATKKGAGEVRQAMMKQLMLRMVTTQGGSLAKRPVPISELEYPEWSSRYKNATYHTCQVIDILIQERLIVSNSYESKKGDPTEIINYIEPAHDALILYWDKLSKKNEIKQQEQESQNQAQEKSWLEEQEEILALRHRLIADVQEWQENKQDHKNNKCIDWIIEKINFVLETDVRFNLLDKGVLWIRFSIVFPVFIAFLVGFILASVSIILEALYLRFFLRLLFLVLILIFELSILISIALVSISPKLFFLLLNKSLGKLPYLNHIIRSNETDKKLGKLIWDKDLRLEQVRQFLYSKDSWLNKGETEFVRQSVIEKQRTKFLSSTVREIVGTVIVALGVVAFLGYRQANLKKTDVLIKSAEEKLNLNNDLNATIDILHAYKILDKNPFLLSVSEEKNKVKKTMNRVFYEVRESNKIQVNRGNVYHMALSPDGTKLVTIGEDDTVILWNTSTGKQLDQFQTEQNEVWSLAFSPDSQLIATGGDDGTVKLWEIDKNDDNNVKPWKNNNGNSQLYSEPFKTQPQIYSIAFINDKNVEQGKYKLATIGVDDTVTVWDISSGNKEGEIKTGQENILSLAFSSQNNSKLLAIVGGDNKLRICKISFVKQKVKLCDKSNNKEYIEKVSEDENILYSVAFTDDGKIATGGKDGKVKLWEIDTNNNVKISATQPDEKEIQQGAIYSLGWSSTNKGTNKLATLGADGTVFLRDPSGKEILPIRPPERIIPNTSVAISPDGEKLATANEEGWLQLWDHSGKRLSRIRTGQKPVNSVVFSPDPDPDQRFIVTGGKDKENGTLKLWDMEGNKLDEITQKEEVMSVVFNPQNDKQLGTFGTDGTFQVWEISKDKSTFTHNQLTEPIPTQITQVKSAVFTPDADQVITLTENGTVQLFQLLQDPQQPETLLENLENFPVDIKSLALSPKGEKLAIGGNDGTIWVWNGSENQPTGLLQTQQGSIDALAYISNDKFATVGEDGTLRIWKTLGNPPIELPTTEQGTRSIAFSFDSDNTKLATVGEDGTVSLWDTSDTSDEQPKPIPTQSGVATSVALSPNGNWLVIGDKDGKVKLLNTSGNQLGEIPLEQGVVTDLSFSSDDKLLVTIGEDNQRQSFWLVTLDQTGSSSNASNPTFKLSKKQLCFDSVALSDDGTLVAGVNQPGVNKKGIVKVYSSNVSLESLDKACREKLPEQTEEFPTQQGGITSIALSSKNSLLATAGEDGSLRLGNTKGTQFDKMPTLQGQINRVVFSPDGTLLATIGKKADTNKTTLKLWKISEEDSTIDDNPFNPFKSLAKWLSGAERDYKLSPFKTLDNISNVAFSPDGKFLATLATEGEKGVNGKVRLWKLGTDEELFDEICNWAKDYLQNSPSLSTSDRQLCDKASNPQDKASNSQ